MVDRQTLSCVTDMSFATERLSRASAPPSVNALREKKFHGGLLLLGTIGGPSTE
jgi:hypothetical protein